MSCLKLVDVIIGNSSSGLLEAPTLKVPTINIGDRQKGRLISQSVIDCKPERKEIIYNLKKILNSKKNFKFKNPYGRGGASKKIIRVLENLNYNNLLKKSFYNNLGKI